MWQRMWKIKFPLLSPITFYLVIMTITNAMFNSFGIIDVMTKGGPTGDYKRIIEEMNYPWFQNKEWQRQLKMALEMGVRIEQQALANKSLEFVAKEYLPEKINNGELLP